MAISERLLKESHEILCSLALKVCEIQRVHAHRARFLCNVGHGKLNPLLHADLISAMLVHLHEHLLPRLLPVRNITIAFNPAWCQTETSGQPRGFFNQEIELICGD